MLPFIRGFKGTLTLTRQGETDTNVHSVNACTLFAGSAPHSAFKILKKESVSVG